jgi:TolB-like protein/DNA-binding winged helix-turn-helix (wHTH) protein/lipopolysaccharide biosynthesis regulator YciM
VATQPGSSPVVRFADFDFDMRTGELRRNRTSLKLQPQPAKVLALLVSRPGEIVTRQDLAQQVWGSETFVDFEQGLNFAIRQIRSALEDNAEHPRFLETLPKRGYRFTASVSGAAPSQSEIPAPSVAPLPPRRRLLLRYGLVFMTIAAVALTLALALDWGHLRQRLSSGATSAPRIESLAVLPLHNLSRDPEQEYFSDGVTDELITDLAKFGGLRVTSHTSVERYKDTKRPLPEIARELDVDAVVEGTVTRSGDRVRITAQLIDGRSDRHLWAESYERDLRDVLALQNEVSGDIAKEIQIKVTTPEKSPLASARPVSPEAHEAYLKGRYFWNKRSEEGVRKGIDYFEQATRIDPNYAVAYAGLAESYIVLNGYRFLPPTQAFPKARAAALKALELDERLAEAHSSLGSYQWEYEWDKSGAEKEFRRAIELNPSYATAHAWYAEELAALGRGDQALAEIKRAREVDPLSLPISVVAGWILYVERDNDQAIDQFQRTLEMDSNFAVAHLYLGRAYVQKGNLEQAIVEAKTATRLSGSHPFYMAWLGYAYARAGNRNEALHILRQLKVISGKKYVPSHDVAAVYVGLGENSKAIAWLNKGYDEHSYTVLQLGVEPEFDSLRSDLRFQDLLQRALSQ